MRASRQGNFRLVLADAPLVKAVGRILGAQLEEHERPEEIDHIWIRIDAGGDLVVSVNTTSKKNRLAGFDPRIRVGIVRGTWDQLPVCGAEICSGNDYGEIEARENIFYEHYLRSGMEELLMSRCERAFLLEVWGAPYRHRLQGIHQIHSRRASCAVPEDIVGRDGALKFYFESGQATEQFLFKFCGQP